MATKMRLGALGGVRQKEGFDDDGNLMPIIGDDDGNYLPDPDGGGSYGPDPEYGNPPPVTSDNGHINNPNDPAPDPGLGDGGGGAGGASSIIASILRTLGIGSGGTGSGGTGGLGGLTGILSLLGPIISGITTHNATGHATDSMLRANENATNFLQGQMGSGDARMLPYTDQGREAVWNMRAMGPRPLAGKYQPLGSGRGMVPLASLAGKAR